jgi:hypothetical protein
LAQRAVPCATLKSCNTFCGNVDTFMRVSSIFTLSAVVLYASVRNISTDSSQRHRWWCFFVRCGSSDAFGSAALAHPGLDAHAPCMPSFLQSPRFVESRVEHLRACEPVCCGTSPF